MRTVLLLLCICISAVIMTGQPNDGSNPKGAGTKPVPTTATDQHQDATTRAAKAPDDGSPWRYAAIKGAIERIRGAVGRHARQPDWWLVIIAAFTGAAIFYQAKEMTEATKVMMWQVTLMQAQFDQWVDLRNWIVNRTGDTLFAVVDLANPTGFPITITNGHIAVHMAAGKVGRTNLGGIVLSPSNPTPIRFDILDLSPWNEGQARSGYAELSGMISHDHRITRDNISHPFAGKLYFNNFMNGKWEANFVQLSPNA
jgi:hypothetical protein